eukprot:3662741-Alexandrium_andersonii.AAC.1
MDSCCMVSARKRPKWAGVATRRIGTCAQQTIMQQAPHGTSAWRDMQCSTDTQHSVNHLTRACSAEPVTSPDVSRRTSGTT